MRSVPVLLCCAWLVGGCGGEDVSFDRLGGGDSPLAAASEAEIAEAAEAFRPRPDDAGTGSVREYMTLGFLDEFDASEKALLDLLPPPGAFGEFEVASAQADDPNGGARIGEYWYPPRVVRRDCSAKIDAAPGPYALANYTPGHKVLDGSSMAAGLDLMAAALVVGIQVQVFDAADQRDGYLDATLEFYRDPSFSCGGKRSTIQTFRETRVEFGTSSVTVFEPEPALFGSGVSGYTAIDDRVLLTVSIGSDAVEAPWSAEDIETWLGPVVEVAVARLATTDLP